MLETENTVVNLTVIDKTTRVEVSDGVTVQSIEPACDLRMSELAANGLARDEVDGARITFNGSTWTVKTHAMRPSPAGELQGEIRLTLEAAI